MMIVVGDVNDCRYSSPISMEMLSVITICRGRLVAMRSKVEEKSDSMKCVFNSVENNLAVITLFNDESNMPSNSAEIESVIGDSVFEKSLIFDCGNIQYICSEEIGWLLQCHRKVSKNGGSLILHSVSGFAIETLQLMKLDSVLTIVDNADDAMSAVSNN